MLPMGGNHASRHDELARSSEHVAPQPVPICRRTSTASAAKGAGKERRELQYQQDREWRNRVFLERNASQEQQDRLFHQQRQQFLQQQVVAAVTSVRDKYELPPEVPF